MERDEALQKLTALLGTDLRPLADHYDVTVWGADGKINKGWAGHTIERFLGLPLNSSRSPNFGSWELKQVSLKWSRKGVLQVKETMAITMIDPYDVEQKPFEQSHLLNKLRKIIAVARVAEGQQEVRSLVHSVAPFDLDNPFIYSQVKADYDLIRSTITTQGFAAVRSEMGTLVQARTKGPGHGSISRAFYARTAFVAHILGVGHKVPIKVEP